MAGAIDGINNLNTAFEGVMSTLQKSSGGEFIEDSPQGSLDFWRCGRKARGNIRLFGNEIEILRRMSPVSNVECSICE
jgi:hypothetical protein